jgi:glyoxylase-like metal-dependent hydrolase (beta-lactamase superfamily II)
MNRQVRQEQEDPSSEVVEIAPGVLRMQLPISMPGLGHVNCYAIPDRRGVAIVDPGLPGDDSWGHLVDRLAKAGYGVGDVHTVLITHAHPDHFGNAGRMANEAGAEVVTHSAFRRWWTPNPADPCNHDGDDEVYDVDPDDLEPPGDYAERTPWGGPLFGEAQSETQRVEIRERMQAMQPPNPTRRVRDHQPIRLGDKDWFAVHTPGHTLDHLCLHNPEDGLFFSGDHVLPTITPHISGLRAGRDPLKLFVDSLDKVAALDDVRLVLPAHGHPFTDMAGRVEKTKIHHLERMEKLREASAAIGPATVEELARELFSPRAWGHLADSETYAHLEHLRLAGMAECREGADGKLIYEVLAVSTV